jgi:hypothetical protein
LTICVCLACHALAQTPRSKGPGQGSRGGANIPREDIRFTATLKAMQNGLLQVAHEDGSLSVVKVPDRGQNTYVVGSATREWLEKGGARGLQVRFVGTFDKSGNSVSPVTQLFVFSPRQWGGNRGDDYKLGVYPEGPGGELKGVFSSEGDAKPAPTVMDFRVVGQLAGIGKDSISVAAGSTRVSAKLAEDARISVDIGDLRYASAGDKVEVEGWHLPGQPQQVYANRLTITTANPLGTSTDEKPGDEKDGDEAK